MKIAISGCANTGKSTLVDAFLKRYPMYWTPTDTYRDVIRNNNLKHSSNTNEETQLMILDWMMNTLKENKNRQHCLYDRCPWDNLAYTLYGNSKGLISDEVTAASISLVREAMKDIDIIFWLEYNPNIKIVEDGLRDANKDYIIETNSIFEDLFEQYMENLEIDIFYPKEDCPAIICIDDSFTTVDDKLMLIGEFIDINGDLIETESSLLDPSNSELFEQMIKDQVANKESDDRISKLIKEFKQ